MSFGVNPRIYNTILHAVKKAKFFNEDLLNKTNKKLKEIGFKYVTLDMAGYEMGSMNK